MQFLFIAYCLIGLSYYCNMLSFWVSECNNRIEAHNELNQFRSDIPRSLRRPRRPKFSSEYFTEMLLSYIFGPSAVKYGILSNNRRNKLHAVIDCLFFFYFCGNSTASGTHKLSNTIENKPQMSKTNELAIFHVIEIRELNKTSTSP